MFFFQFFFLLPAIQDPRLMIYGIFLYWSTYNPTISPVFTSVHTAKPFSEGKQWKLKEPKQVISPFFTLSYHCLNEKPRCYVTTFCEKHYIEQPSESQCPTENPLLNWDKLFLKCLVTVWFSDLYILNCSKDIHNIKTQRAHGLHLSQRTWVQAISDRCLLLFNHFSICVIWSEVPCALLMDCLRRTSEKTRAGAIIYPSKYFHLSHHFLSFSMVGRNSDVQPSLFYLIFLRKKIWFNQLQVTASHSRSIQTTGSGKSCELFYLVQILKLVSPPPWLPSSYRIPAFVILYYLHKKCTWIFKRIYPRLTLWAESRRLHFHFVIVRQQYSREPVRPSLKQSNLLHSSKGKVRSSLH